MKTLVIYTSQTGFTRRYAEWLADRTNADILEIKEAQKKDAVFFSGYDAIASGGWAMAGKVVRAGWFLDRAAEWKDKRLAVFCVGASPNDNPDLNTVLHNMLTDEQRRYIRAFYCQGGLRYEKMKMPSKMMMKMFSAAMNKKKGKTESEKKMAEMISGSYDISDKSYIEPIAEYLRTGGR